ncbi:hypothetical protein V6N13_038255 [Hibiscus sabdariffa]
MDRQSRDFIKVERKRGTVAGYPANTGTSNAEKKPHNRNNSTVVRNNLLEEMVGLGKFFSSHPPLGSVESNGGPCKMMVLCKRQDKPQICTSGNHFHYS